jgi:hypothetical protein
MGSSRAAQAAAGTIRNRRAFTLAISHKYTMAAIGASNIIAAQELPAWHCF